MRDIPGMLEALGDVMAIALRHVLIDERRIAAVGGRVLPHRRGRDAEVRVDLSHAAVERSVHAPQGVLVNIRLGTDGALTLPHMLPTGLILLGLVCVELGDALHYL